MTETACPFCEAALDLSASPAPLPPAARLTRAALYALGAGTLTLASACGGVASTSSPRDRGADAGVDSGVENCCPPYGATPAPDGGYGPVYGAAPEDSGPVIAPPYGLPPPLRDD